MSKVKLGDVVERVKEFVDKDNTDLTFYIGGEHFESRSLTIKNRGYINGSTIGPAFHHRFRKGDVLLMSRNPHLRKAGMVDFDGICSDVSYVIRTKDENVIMQKFIPLLFQCDTFWEFAEKNKKGSTNFFLNWSDFEKFEFDLPAIEKQKKIVDVLWSIDNTIDTYNNVIKASDELVKSQFIEMFGNPITNDKHWKTQMLKDIAPECSPNIPQEDKYWWLNLDAIESNSGRLIEKVIVSVKEIGASTSRFDNTMVLYSKLRPYLNKVMIPDDYGYSTSELVGLKPNENILRKEFLFNILRGDEFVAYANSFSIGGQMPRMPMKKLREFLCVLPPIELQDKFISFSKQVDKSKFEIEKALNELKNLYQMIIKQGIC